MRPRPFSGIFIIGMRSDGGIVISVVNLDEQAIAEMPQRQRDKARVRAFGIPERTAEIASEPYCIGDQFGDEQFLLFRLCPH